MLVGRATLDALGIGAGDRIAISLPGDLVAFGPGQARVSHSYIVVGSAVAPTIGEPGNDTPARGRGPALAEALGDLASKSVSTIVLLDLADGAGARAATDRFPDGLPFRFGGSTEWFTSASPAEVSQVARARTVIRAGIGALAVAVVATIVHTLLGAVRQRRREYAVLRALGFTPRQVQATVLWQGGGHPRAGAGHRRARRRRRRPPAVDGLCRGPRHRGRPRGARAVARWFGPRHRPALEVAALLPASMARRAPLSLSLRAG